MDLADTQQFFMGLASETEELQALYVAPKTPVPCRAENPRSRAGSRAFAFELSEDLPPNWQERIPVILDLLSRSI